MNIFIRQFALLSLGLLLGNSAIAVAPVGGPQTLLTLPHVPNQLLVKRQPGVPVEAIEQLLDCVTGILIESSGPAGLDVVAIDEDANLGDALLLLNGNPALIASADLNYIAQLSARPNDLEFSQQWAKDNTGLNGPSGIGHPGADLNLVAGWDTQADAPGVILAVIDDSVDTTHIDLVGNIMSSGRCYASPNSARPCVNGPNDPNPVDAEDFHGTWVAGIAGAEGNNGIGIAGTAWDIDLLPLKVDLSHFAIVQAIDEAIAQGADIINMSFGGPVESQALSDAISRAEQAGILIVAAAGNADGNNAFASSYPANAVQSNVLSVAASTSRDRIASFSQWGSTTVDLAAPGESVRTTTADNSFSEVSGTSFAAPHTAGVAALVQAETGATDYRQLKAWLLHGGIEGRDALGPVSPGQNKQGVPGRVAAGRLDAARALNGPAGGVLIIDRVRIDDSASGNNNARLDPGETALLEITLANSWIDENNVTGTLTTTDGGSLLVNSIAPVMFGNVLQDNTATAAFSVTLSNSVNGNKQLFMQLELESAVTLPTRYFYLEVGTLSNGVPLNQSIQRFNWDEFQAFNLVVPAGATDLTVSTSGTGDVDLLLRHNLSPEYLITLGAIDDSGFYYVDDDSYVSAESGANESISINNPLPGTWHAVVVNFDQQIKSYEINASYALPTSGEIALSADNYSGSEIDGNIQVTVTRSGGVAGATVHYATADQTALGGSDYTAVSGTLTWGLGDNFSKLISIPVTDDSDPELGETFQIVLSDAEGSSLGSPASATVNIVDDDSGSGSVAFTQSVYTVSEGAGSVVLTVSRSNGSMGAASVSFATVAGQAQSGSDFVSNSGVLSWADGDSSDKTATVTIVDDSSQEAQESFSLQLSNPQGVVLGTPASGTIRINDNDVSTPSGNAGGGGGGGSLGVFLLAVLASLRLQRIRS